MLRNSQQFQNKQNLDKDTLKQKKRLSFKEPEIEVTRATPTGFKPEQGPQPRTTFSSWTTKANDLASSRSLEDLSLEDQTISIAHNIGQAFESKLFGKIAPERKRLSLVSAGPSSDHPHPARKPSVLAKETTQNDRSQAGNDISKMKSRTITSPKLSPEDEEYLKALSPPVPDMEVMKCPVFELNDNSTSQQVPSDGNLEFPDRIATSVQHQMQYLKLQLNHQSQQTQAALAHVQLLKDQLQAETSARYKAQVQNHQLITHNKELLNHIQTLFQQIQGLEKKIGSLERKSSTDSCSEDVLFRRKDCLTNDSAIRGNSSSQGTKVSAYAPNPIMANRRSSMTGLKPFQPKIDFSDSSKKREETKLHIGDSSPPIKNVSGNAIFSDLKADSTTLERSSRGYLASGKRNSFAGYGQSKIATNESEKLTNCLLNFGNESSVRRENPLMIEDSVNNKASYQKKPTPEPQTRKDYINTYQTLPPPKSRNDQTKTLRLFDDDTTAMQKANSDLLQIKDNSRFSFTSDSLRLFSN